MGMRRAHEHQPRLAGKGPVVAEEPLAEQQAVVLEPLLRARLAEARDGWVELDLQLGRCQRGLAEREGFEPPVPSRVQQISSLPQSTTLPSLRESGFYQAR